MDNKESSIRKMEKKLYAKKDILKHEERKHFSHTEITTASDWEDEVITKSEKKDEEKPRRTMTAFTKFFLLAFGFFLISITAAFLVFTSGQNTVAYDDTTLSILGPNSVAGGEVLAYDVLITNNNEVDLVLADITIKYPQGAYEVRQDGVPLSQTIRSIERVPRGVTQTERFEVVFFGTEGDIQDINITFGYRVPDSNSLFFKERIYQVQLDSSPVSLEVSAPKETLSGSEVELELLVTSNTNKVIDNLTLQVEYPFGFSFIEATPVPNLETEDLFTLGALQVGQTKTIKIIGTLSGQDDEIRVFKHRVGLVDKTTNAIGNMLQETESVVTIARPPVTLTAKINEQEKALHIVNPGQNVDLSLNFVNNLASQIQNAQVTSVITGTAFSPRSITTDGFYNSSKQEILWQKTDVPLLNTFTAGAVGKVDARFRILSAEQLAGRIIDPQAKIDYQFNGQTFDFENNSTQAVSTGSVLVKVPTELRLDTRAVHSLGPFQNEGDIELIPDVTSQYTVVWKVSNSTSNTKDIEVQATLPPFVQFIQSTDTTGTVMEFNAETRKISWTIDALEAGAGYGSKPGVETTFQIAVTPSTQQIGRELNFTENQTMKGFDTFTNTVRLYTQLDPVTSRSLLTDPQATNRVFEVQDIE